MRMKRDRLVVKCLQAPGHLVLFLIGDTYRKWRRRGERKKKEKDPL